MHRIYIILNPVAGSGNGEKTEAMLMQRLVKKDVTYTIYRTTGNENMDEIIQAAIENGYDSFIVAGGDGTISEVIDQLAGKDLPMGIIPLGTSSILARESGIPLDIGAAIDLILGSHQIRLIDAMQVGTRHFVLQVGVGLTAKAVRVAERETKNRLARLAYVWGGIKMVAQAEMQAFTLEIDDTTHSFNATQGNGCKWRYAAWQTAKLGTKYQL